MAAELNETRFEKLSFAGVCALDVRLDGGLSSGEDRPDVGGVGRNAAKADGGIPCGCALLAPSGLVDQSRAERSSMVDCVLAVGENRHYK